MAAAQTLARNSPWLVTKPVRNTGAVCAAVDVSTRSLHQPGGFGGWLR